MLLGSLSGTLLGWLMGFLSLFLVMLILIQRGRGGGLTGALGGPGGQSAFGSKAGDTFTLITVIVATIWGFSCAFTMWLLGTHTPTVKVTKSSVNAGPGDEAFDPSNQTILPTLNDVGTDGTGLAERAGGNAGDDTTELELVPAQPGATGAAAVEAPATTESESVAPAAESPAAEPPAAEPPAGSTDGDKPTE